MAGFLGLVDDIGTLGRDDHLLGVHAVLRKVFYIHFFEVARTHVNGDEGFVNVLQNHAVKELAAEMQTGGRSLDGALVGRKNGLIIDGILGRNRILHPVGDRRLAHLEQGLFEFLVGSVEQETQGTAARGGIVNHLGHQRTVLAEIQFVADADLAGRIHNHVPQPLLAVQLPQQENHDIGPRLFFLAIEARGEDLGIVQHEGVTLPEIIDDILENLVFDFSGLSVEDEHARFVTPTGGLLGYPVFGQDELELR